MRRNSRGFYFLSVLLISVYSLFAQQTNPLPSNTLSASSYNGGSAVAANYFTGLPIINLPLISYSHNALSLNLSLGYSSAGTQVQQVASSVGLGWNLILSSGYVRRIVIGFPDEYKYVSSGNTINSGYLRTSNLNVTSPSRADLDNIYNNKNDAEEDIYEYSVPGYSGRILISKGGQVQGTIPQTDLIISYTTLPNQGRINSFKIQTPEGLIYEFNEEEVLKFPQKVGAEANFQYASNWFIKKMYSVLNPNEQIVFSYESYYSNEILGRSYFYGQAKDPNVYSQLGSACAFSGGACCEMNLPYYNSDSKIDGTLKRPTLIQLSDGSSIKFIYKAGNRSDLIYDKALDSIELINEVGFIAKRYFFDYSYFTTSAESPYFFYPSSVDLNSRLLLKKVTQVGIDGSALPPYSFDYETSITLPPRNLLKSDGTTLKTDPWGFKIPDAGSSEVSAKACILKKITYPTGSYVSYEYQPNTIGWTNSSNIQQQIGGVRLKSIKTNEGITTGSEVEMSYNYDLSTGNSSGQVDNLAINTFDASYDVAKMQYCDIQLSSLHNAAYTNYLSQSPIDPFPSGNACGYSKVTEEIKSGTESLGKKIYYYKNFSDYYTDPILAGNSGIMNFPFPAKQTTFSWGVGLPLIIEVYDKDGNILKKTENHFDVTASKLVSNDLASMKVGLWYGPTNRSNSAVNGDVYKYEAYYPISGKTQLTSTITTDYFYQDNSSISKTVSSETDYEYIPNKNLVRSISSYDSKGNQIKKVFRYSFDYNIPANAAITILNQNGIYQLIATESWIKKGNTNYLTGVEVHDFKILSNGLIKPAIDYILKIANPIVETNIPTFNGTSIFLFSSSMYQTVANYDLYNSKGNIEQVTDGHGTSTTSIYTNDGLLPIAVCKNSTKDQCAYTSFENISGYDLQGQVENNLSLTGKLVFYDGVTGKMAFKGQIISRRPTGKYIVSVWCKGSDVSITAPSYIEGKKNIKAITGGWNLYTWVVDIVATSALITVNSNGQNMDELRIYPVNASMATQTYNTLLQKNSTCSADNRINYFGYDPLGRLVLERDENKNILSRNCYKYADETDNCNIEGNFPTSVVVTKDNCSSGYLGSQMTFTIPAESYFAKDSYQALLLAQSELNSLKPTFQAIVDEEGTCTYQPIYVRLERTQDYYYSDPYYDIESTVYVVRFYSNSACTTPFTLTQDLVINYHYWTEQQNNGYYYYNDSYGSIIGLAGTTENDEFNYTELKYDTYDGYSWSHTGSNYSLTPGPNYIIR